jgi:NADH-quinone oxidoreductase subunit J
MGGAFVVLVTAGVYRATSDVEGVGLAAAQPEGNVQAIGLLLFTKYVFAFEVTAALLITAALGAMVLAHKESTEPKLSQRELAKKRFSEPNPHPLPGPGVYSTRHSNATPALLPDGSEAPGSVSPVLESTSAESFDRGGSQ